MLTLTPADASTLVSQGIVRGRTRDGQYGKPHSKCDHCHRLGHTIDKCLTSHDRPARTANVAYVDKLIPSELSIQPTTSPTTYADFLK